MGGEPKFNWKREQKMSVRNLFRMGFLAVLFATAGQVQAGFVVHTTDFINNANRTHFNGFENITTVGPFYDGGSGPYTEDTIQVQQINATTSIWVTYNFGSGFEGNYGWYPNGGDNGYSEISLTGGSKFDLVGFNVGTGYFSGVSEYLFELLDNNSVVFSGAISGSSTYLGFSGGVFDTIRVRDSVGGGGNVTDGAFQAMTFDSIETASVPEPASMVIWSIGALGMGLVARRRAKKFATV
jgi:hypothetical protein